MDIDVKDVLKQRFGFDQFRPGQQQAVTQLLSGESTLAIFPTGSGKSLCYQLTALQLPHLTLVVSPLLALIKDQLAFLAKKGIPAASIDSTLTPEDMRKVMADVRSGQLKILMVSVERFKNERFRRFIEQVPVSMLVVDEAHCISEWGHNFRPDYLKLPAYRDSLNIPLVLLLTATATRKVKRDMARKFAITDAHIVQTGFYRPNLELDVVPVSAAGRDDVLMQQLVGLEGAGIVYVTLQHTAEQVAARLCERGFRAVAYHAGLPDESRQRIQSDFMAGHEAIVVATIAFGMGIDKSNIRFVIHYDLPKSIENYSQEIGRAGRDGDGSRCITLANLDGMNVLENFVYGDTPELAGVEAVLEHIRAEQVAGRWEVQLLSLSNDTNVRQLPLKTLLVQLEMQGVIQPLFSYFAEIRYKFVQPQAEVLARFEGERQAFLASVFQHSQFKRVWGEPDFEALYHGYGADRARVMKALEYLQQLGCIAIESKRMTDVYSVDVEALAEPALAAQLHSYFVEKEHSEINRIAALVRFFELDRCLSQNLSGYFDDRQAPQQCGHCSVCAGRTAVLSRSELMPWPGNDRLRQLLAELSARLSGKVEGALSVALCSRFLAGITVPVFSRNKVRQLSGFGICEQQRYEEIQARVSELLAE